MSIFQNRLLLKLEQARKKINRNTINPRIRTLTLKELEPIVQMVAETRAAYVEELFDMANGCKGRPTDEQIARLRELREAFQETVEAANALESMIDRGYLDVCESIGTNREALTT